MPRVIFIILLAFIISINHAQKKNEISIDSLTMLREISQIDAVKDSNHNTQNTLSYFLDSHLFWGIEMLEPYQPRDRIITATRLWKTDLRFGLEYNYSNSISSFISVRDMDSPRTDNMNLYEAGVRIKKDWGTLWIGQSRIQIGNESHYLNAAFDRSFWDRGLIADFLIRGAGTKINYGKSDLELIIGTDKYSYAIGIASYSLKIIEEVRGRILGAYIARDENYSGYGYYTGVEFKESTKNFFGYQVIAYKELDQEPSPVKEITYFLEGRYTLNNRWKIGAAYLNKKTIDNFFTMDEIRTCADIYYTCSDFISSSLTVELFQSNYFKEVQIGFSPHIQFDKSVLITPRIRYIITETGPDIGQFGIDCHFKF